MLSQHGSTLPGDSRHPRGSHVCRATAQLVRLSGLSGVGLKTVLVLAVDPFRCVWRHHLQCALRGVPWLKVQLGSGLPQSRTQGPGEQMEAGTTGPQGPNSSGVPLEEGQVLSVRYHVGYLFQLARRLLMLFEPGPVGPDLAGDPGLGGRPPPGVRDENWKPCLSRWGHDCSLG